MEFLILIQLADANVTNFYHPHQLLFKNPKKALPKNKSFAEQICIFTISDYENKTLNKQELKNSSLSISVNSYIMLFK